jgi:hypothetical protein
MAQAELRYGRNQPLQRIAQEIVVEELQEIAAMQLAVGDKVSPSAALLAASKPAAAARPHRSSANPGGTNSRLLAGEQPFLAENDTAMSKMMADMTIRPSGDIDRDFVAMMIPHHQGAIDMAQAELRHGHNAQRATSAHRPGNRRRSDSADFPDALRRGRDAAAPDLLADRPISRSGATERDANASRHDEYEIGIRK